ncbi:SRPBCC domain-containing protein [Micromonospora fulviviridis]|uniref:SRPBCC domain-containing protein n=1 Tax=Micromonospora fulviviridis TaxID=47860 RepID=UPI00379C682B
MPVDDRSAPAPRLEPRPGFTGVEPDDFPLLHRNGGYPLAQDRWERLVSQVHIPAPADRVWSALTDPEQVAQWLAVCRGGWATADGEAILDFEDGEFFFCRIRDVREPASGGEGRLSYLWRWVGVGPATEVTWQLTATPHGTQVTVVEEAFNPPSDWRSWNGMGWPGILDQLADFIRTGVPWRWPWRRMGPYVQTELPGTTFEVWGLLTSTPATQFWFSRTSGSLDAGSEVGLILGDASGVATMKVTRHVEAYQQFPSYLPRLEFNLRRPGWPGELEGHLWIEPAGLGGSIIQVFHSNWEALSTIAPPLDERKILTGYWVGAFGRAALLCQRAFGDSFPAAPPGRDLDIPADLNGTGNGQRVDAGPHGWSR